MVILQINIMDTNENLLNDAYNSIIDQIYKYCDRLIEQKMINRFDFMNKNVPALTQLYNELTHDISITDYMILTSYFMNLFRIKSMIQSAETESLMLKIKTLEDKNKKLNVDLTTIRAEKIKKKPTNISHEFALYQMGYTLHY